MRKLIYALILLAAPLMAVAGGDMAELARLRELADSFHSAGRTDSAAIIGEQAIALAEQSGEPTQIVGTHSSQGVFLRSLGRIDEALANYDAALAIVTSGQFREHPDEEATEEIGTLYVNLAVLNLDTQHKEQAAANAIQAGEWAAKSDDAAFRSTLRGVAGSVLTACGDLERAMDFQRLAYDDALASGDKESAFRVGAYTMLTAYRMGSKDQEQEWRQRCQELLPEIDSAMAKLVYYQAECSIALTMGDMAESIKWFDRILATDGIDNLPFVKFDCYNNMHVAYAGLGDYKNAYETLQLGSELRDSLWQIEKTESLRDLTVKYQTKETELALAQSEAKRAGTLMWLFAALGLLLAAIVVFVAYANRQRHRRLQREIEFANLRADIGRQLTQQYVEGLENERQRMSRELHDGVCNDLLAIEMNISSGKPIESTARLIESCREEVRRISHELMPPEFAYANLDEVVRYYAAKQAEGAGGAVAVSYESEGSDWTAVPDAVALEVYRIAQEAVGNAIKHSGATEIRVALRLADGLLELTVADNGTYKPAKKKGIGMDSIRRRANAIGGEIEVTALEQGGTQVKLRAKMPL